MTSDRHGITPYPLRLTPEMRARLDDASKVGKRSLHAEIVSQLDKSFDVASHVDAVAALEFRLALSESNLLACNNDLQDVCLLALKIIQGLSSDDRPSAKEVTTWTAELAYLAGFRDSNRHRSSMSSVERSAVAAGKS